MTELEKKLYVQKSMTLQDRAREYPKQLEQLTREGTALALQLQQMNGEQLARELGLLQIKVEYQLSCRENLKQRIETTKTELEEIIQRIDGENGCVLEERVLRIRTTLMVLEQELAQVLTDIQLTKEILQSMEYAGAAWKQNAKAQEAFLMEKFKETLIKAFPSTEVYRRRGEVVDK